MDRGAWQATVNGVAKRQTRLNNFYHVSLRTTDIGSPLLLKLNLDDFKQSGKDKAVCSDTTEFHKF